jgi:signal transduction histidine kinase
VYRIATEALNNSLKHSRASEVNVALSATPQYFELVIQDNGIGFDLGQKSAGGMGLITMHERSNRIGGSLTIDSKPQTGTRVILTVPVNQAQPAQKEAVA